MSALFAQFDEPLMSYAVGAGTGSPGLTGLSFVGWATIHTLQPWRAAKARSALHAVRLDGVARVGAPIGPAGPPYTVAPKAARQLLNEFACAAGQHEFADLGEQIGMIFQRSEDITPAGGHQANYLAIASRSQRFNRGAGVSPHHHVGCVNIGGCRRGL